MRVLLMQQPKSVSRYGDWLNELVPDAEVAVFTSRNRRRDGDWGPASLVEVDDYSSSTADLQFLELVRRFKPERIVSSSEEDVIRAAEARDIFGITGMRGPMAMAFRDKVRMKAIFADAGIRSPAHLECLSLSQVADALHAWGQIVLKPRWGAGAAGVTVLRGFGQLAECLKDPSFVDAVHSNHYFIEEFIDGDVFHVDVVCAKGRPVLISPSQYLKPPMGFASSNTGSVMVDASSVEHEELQELARRLVSSLSDPQAVHVLHIEFFRTHDGSWVAGEVACRRGGGGVKDSILAAFGVDLSKANLAGELGVDVSSAEAVTRQRQYGWVLETAGFRHVSRTQEPDWLQLTNAAARTGGPSNSVDALRKALVGGSSAGQIQSRIAALVDGTL